MPRPTPRQRAVLEAMSANEAGVHRVDGSFWWWRVNSTDVMTTRRVVDALADRRWVKRVAPTFYVITEAGRRAVAQSDGGV